MISNGNKQKQQKNDENKNIWIVIASVIGVIVFIGILAIILTAVYSAH